MEEMEQHFLSVGTEVSAKYRGAFCEAKIKSVKKNVIFKVSNKKDGRSYNITEESIKGVLKTGATVEAQFPDHSGWIEGTIITARDKSVYTVEFDDGDVRTLTRGSLCLQGVRHFAESETLDHLPLTDPENFGTPVLSAKRKPKRKALQSSSADGDEDNDSDDQKSPDRETGAKRKLAGGPNESKDEGADDKESDEEKRKKWLADPLMGRLVIIEPPDKRKHWYPAVCVNPMCYEDYDEVLDSHIVVRSFKTGKLADVEQYAKLTRNDIPVKVESSWKEVLEAAFSWEDSGTIPDMWRMSIKDILEQDENQNQTNKDVKHESPEEREKNHDFLEQLYKFMEDRGTPMNKNPVLGYKDLNLYLLYNLVQAKGGFHAISNAADWREIYSNLGIPKVSQAAGHHVKQSYRKYLLAFEEYLASFIKILQQKARQKKTKKKETTAKTKEKKLIKAHSVSGRASPSSSRSDDDNSNEAGARRSSRRRKMSETVAADEPEVTPPPKASKRSRRSRNDADGKLDSDADDASSTASSEKSTTRGRLTSTNNESPKTAQKTQERNRSNSGASARRKSGHIYKPNDKIRVKYGKDSFKLYTAKVVDVDVDEGPEVQYYVHYLGWNSRHDEWIKAWQIAGCIEDNDSTTPCSSPASGRLGSKRPKTPTPSDSGEKKQGSNMQANLPSVSLSSVSLSELRSISQALDFSSPPSSTKVQEKATELPPSKPDTKKETPVSNKKQTKARTRRQSTSSTTSTHSATSVSSKRTISEENSVAERVEASPTAAAQESKEATPPTVKTEARSTTPSFLPSRRTSSRRSKSPAYLRESALYGMTRRKRTSSITSSENVPASTSESSNVPTADLDEASTDSVHSTPSPSSETNAVESSTGKWEENAEKPSKEAPARRKSTEPKVESPKVKEEKSDDKTSQETYDNFDEEAPVIALEKPRQPSPIMSVKHEHVSEELVQSALSRQSEKAPKDELYSVVEEICKAEVKNFTPEVSQLEGVVAAVSEQLPAVSKTSDARSVTDESENSAYAPDAQEENNMQWEPEQVEPEEQAAPAPSPPAPQAIPAPAVPPPVLQEVPTGSKVLMDNTPPTTPEASPEHYYEEQDMNEESDNAPMVESGASSLSGEAPASSSSPDYPAKDELPADGKNEAMDADTESTSSVQHRTRPVSTRRRSASKVEEDKSRENGATADTDSDDDTPSGEKQNEVTPSKRMRRPNKKKAKIKPEPPSAPPPVVGEELAKMDPDERIQVLQSKLAEMRKVYQQLKQEVSSIDRKRKRAKRREQEASELASPAKKHAPSSPSKRDDEDSRVACVEKAAIDLDIAASNGGQV